MKQKFFWLDLALCSLWIILICGGRDWGWVMPFSLLVVVAMMIRVALSFFLYRGDKRSWIPLSVFWALTVFVHSCKYPLGFGEPAIFTFNLLQLQFDRTLMIWLNSIFSIWFMLLPTAWYFVSLFRRKLTDTGLTWKDGLGAIFWTDEKAITYAKLLLVAVSALNVGLAMYSDMCSFACFVLPTLSFVILARFYHSPIRKIWLMVISMYLFIIAQHYGGAWRIVLLAASLFIVGYLCFETFLKNRKRITLSIFAFIYHGVILPSIIIGYNQYTCIGYARYWPLESLRGIFEIRDPETGKKGLRDRYGLLITPIYDEIEYHGSRHLWGELELRKNGYYDLYQIANNRFSDNPGIEQYLQDKICPLISKHKEYYDYNYNDRIEVIVTDYETNTRISHLKSSGKGGDNIYDYKQKPFIIPDTASILPGDFKADSLVSIDDWTNKQVLRYSHDVMNDSIPQFNIEIRTAKDEISRQGELLDLASKMEELVKEWLE